MLTWIQLSIADQRETSMVAKVLVDVLMKLFSAGLRPVLATCARPGQQRCLSFPNRSVTVRVGMRRWYLHDIECDNLEIMWNLAICGEELFGGRPDGKTQILIGAHLACDYAKAISAGKLRLERALFVNDSYWDICSGVIHAYDNGVAIELSDDRIEQALKENAYIRMLECDINSKYQLRELLWEWKQP